MMTADDDHSPVAAKVRWKSSGDDGLVRRRKVVYDVSKLKDPQALAKLSGASTRTPQVP